MLSEDRKAEDRKAEDRKAPATVSGRDFPQFRPLVMAALAVNTPLLAWFLIAGRPWTALSVLAGLGVGLAVYGSLHLFVGRGLEPLLAGLRGRARPATGGVTALFALTLPLKYLAIGAVMFLLIRGGHLSLLWFGIGFVVTQISITTATVAHLARPPRR